MEGGGKDGAMRAFVCVFVVFLNPYFDLFS